MASEVPWASNWLWGVPLIVLTVTIHVGCLGLFTLRLETYLAQRAPRHGFVSTFILVICIAVLGVTVLHSVEGGIWATAYWMLGALPDEKTAVLYSINALTSYGHLPIYLRDPWKLLGSLEALNGMILFGLTTAFLFAMIQRVWPAFGPGPTARP
jgi:hypothetical protein